MTDLTNKLRDAVQKLRRTPMPIADVAPLLTQAADEIDQLRAKVAEMESQIELSGKVSRKLAEHCLAPGAAPKPCNYCKGKGCVDEGDREIGSAVMDCDRCNATGQAAPAQWMKDVLATGVAVTVGGVPVDPSSIYKEAAPAAQKQVQTIDEWMTQEVKAGRPMGAAPAAPKAECVYGENTLGVVHRKNGPCFWPSDDHVSLAQAAPAAQPLPWDGVNLDGMLEALNRLHEGYYHSKNPFHSPVWDDAALALRELKHMIPSMKRYGIGKEQQ